MSPETDHKRNQSAEAKVHLWPIDSDSECFLDAAKKNAADKDAAAKIHTTTSGTTTGGGVEDKVKAAEAAKATVTESGESQLNALKATQAGTTSKPKGAFDGPIAASAECSASAKKNVL